MTSCIAALDAAEVVREAASAGLAAADAIGRPELDAVATALLANGDAEDEMLDIGWDDGGWTASLAKFNDAERMERRARTRSKGYVVAEQKRPHIPWSVRRLIMLRLHCTYRPT